MQRCRLLLLPLALISLEGCQNHVGIEDITLRHKDEIRKQDDLVLLADRRVFAAMAFANAVGFDGEAKGQPMHPVRARVRSLVAERLAWHPEKLRRWKEYYGQTLHETRSITAFAPSLSTDYPFRWIGPHHPLGHMSTGDRLEQLPDVLNNFWETVDLGGIWAEVKPAYIEEMDRYDLGLMNRQLHFVWQYLRVQRDDNDMIVQIPNLLASHHSVCRVHHDNCLCCIEGPGSVDHTFNIHAYLHSIVNEIVTQCYPQYADKLETYYSASDKELLPESYQDPAVFTCECLVRALDRRMRILLADNPGQTQAHKDSVQRDTHKGLTLTQPFHLLLTEFEKGNMPFDEFVPVMLGELPENDGHAYRTAHLSYGPITSSAGLAKQEEAKRHSVDSMNVVASGYTSLCLEQ